MYSIDQRGTCIQSINNFLLMVFDINRMFKLVEPLNMFLYQIKK